VNKHREITEVKKQEFKCQRKVVISSTANRAISEMDTFTYLFSDNFSAEI